MNDLSSIRVLSRTSIYIRFEGYLWNVDMGSRPQETLRAVVSCIAVLFASFFALWTSEVVSYDGLPIKHGAPDTRYLCLHSVHGWMDLPPPRNTRPGTHRVDANLRFASSTSPPCR